MLPNNCRSMMGAFPKYTSKAPHNFFFLLAFSMYWMVCRLVVLVDDRVRPQILMASALWFIAQRTTEGMRELQEYSIIRKRKIDYTKLCKHVWYKGQHMRSCVRNCVSVRIRRSTRITITGYWISGCWISCTWRRN